MWVKDEIKKIHGLWNSATTKEICERLNVDRAQLGYIVLQMRRAGFNLPKKHENGKLQGLLKEVLSEI